MIASGFGIGMVVLFLLIAFSLTGGWKKTARKTSNIIVNLLALKEANDIITGNNKNDVIGDIIMRSKNKK